MKQYQFDLSNLINDLSLMTDSTGEGALRTKRILGLRNKKLGKGSLTGKVDKELWKKTITKQTYAIEDSILKCDKIIAALESLQENTLKAKNVLDESLDGLR